MSGPSSPSYRRGSPSRRCRIYAHASFTDEYHLSRSAPLHRSIYDPGVHSAVTAIRYCSPMRDDEFRRFYEACLAMAAQSTDTDVRARWLAMADAWLKRATNIKTPIEWRSTSIRGTQGQGALLESDKN